MYMRKTKRRGGIPLKKLAAAAALLSGRSMASTDIRRNPVIMVPDRMEIMKRDVPMGNERDDVDIFITEVPNRRSMIPDHDFEVMRSDVRLGKEKDDDLEYSMTELPSPRRRRKSAKKKKNGKKAKSVSRSKSKSRSRSRSRSKSR